MLLLCIQGKRAERGDWALEGVCVRVCVWCFMCTHSRLLGESTLVSVMLLLLAGFELCFVCVACVGALLPSCCVTAHNESGTEGRWGGWCSGPQVGGPYRLLVGPWLPHLGNQAAWVVFRMRSPPTCCDSVVQESYPVHSTNDEGSEITVTPYFSVTYVKQVLKNPVSRHPGVVLDGVRTEKGVLSRSPSDIFTFSAAALILQPASALLLGHPPLISLPPRDSCPRWWQCGPSSLFVHWFCLGVSPALLDAVGPADSCVHCILWTLFFFLSWSWQV